MRRLTPDSLDFIILLQLVILAFMDPTLSFGKSIGLLYSLVILGFIFCSFIIACLVSKFLHKKLIPHVLTTSILTAVLAVLSMMIVDHYWKFQDELIAKKIRYYCKEQFSQKKCVKLVSLCPECTSHIDRWERLIMAENLKSYRSTYSTEDKAVLKDTPQTRLPANK